MIGQSIVSRLSFLSLPSLNALSILAVCCVLFHGQIAAQTPSSSPNKNTAVNQEDKKAVDTNTPSTAARGQSVPEYKEGRIFNDMIKRFSETYRLGPSDQIAIRVKGQPDYSVEKVKVSPMGTIFHPLLGEIQVAGLTMDQLKKQLTTDLSEYLVDPVVNAELLEAQSAKVGVIGQVRMPRIIVMSGPLTVLDAITEAGGFSEMGKSSNVTLLRQQFDGTRATIKVNVKEILQGKATPDQNLALQAGDTVIVHSNMLRTIGIITSITGFSALLTVLSPAQGGSGIR